MQISSSLSGFRLPAHRLSLLSRGVIAAVMAAVFAAGGSLRADEPTRSDKRSLADSDQTSGFQSLFDGKTLKGWEGDEAWFRVEDGAIVAGSLEKEIPHNYFLCTTEEYGDFELRLQAKLVGEGDNAGVQFRTKRIPDNTEVSGYQADMGRAWNRPVWGALYDESRRNKMLAEPDPEAVKKVLNPDDWNEMVIRCKGPRIEIFLNGLKTVDYTEKDEGIAPRGVIAVQIHSGPPAEAWYRDIQLRPL